MQSLKMAPQELRAVVSLSSIMGLRMIGLFMVLPVFTLYATQLSGANPLLIGLSVGIYGLFQALFQIPFGALSDRIGRKPVILIGLLIFIAGSLIAGYAESITFMVIGRALQGAGAIGSTILACLADLTSEEQRTKAMAIAGISIGFSFSLAMLIGPLLTNWLAVNELFFIAAALASLGILLLYVSVPDSQSHRWHRDAEPELSTFLKLLTSKELAKLNSGIFILHAIFTASFVVIPISLFNYAGLTSHEQWIVYIPALLMAFILTLFFINLAEKKEQPKLYFLGSIAVLMLALILLCTSSEHIFLFGLAICLFFTGFSLLEAFLPSLVSRTAPAARKGSALGLYSCSQFLGIFVGGAVGGWLYGTFSFLGVYLFCISLSLIWLTLASFMTPPRSLITQRWHLTPVSQQYWEEVSQKIAYNSWDS